MLGKGFPVGRPAASESLIRAATRLPHRTESSRFTVILGPELLKGRRGRAETSYFHLCARAQVRRPEPLKGRPTRTSAWQLPTHLRSSREKVHPSGGDSTKEAR